MSFPSSQLPTVTAGSAAGEPLLVRNPTALAHMNSLLVFLNREVHLKFLTSVENLGEIF